MSRRPPPADTTESFGSDSFLDIVANMVGILIILVMVVGLRVKNSVDEDPPEPQAAAPTIDLVPLEDEVSGLESESNELMAKAGQLDALASARFDERSLLSLAVSAKEKELNDEKSKLASTEQVSFELQKSALEAQAELKALESELAALVYSPQKDVIKIKTYPTPISRTVHGREIHFQLHRGRIALVPLDQLADELKHNLQSRTYRMQDLDEMTETVGPIGDFRMRYTLERVTVPAATNGRSISPGGVMIRTSEFTLIPVRDDIGETYSQAMAQESELQRALADLDPRRVTITLWAYPDSFDAYRAMREYMYERGYTVAGRPLPEGQPISGSPYGSKSAAQ